MTKRRYNYENIDNGQFMITKLLKKLNDLQKIDTLTVDRLYGFATRNLIVVLLLAILTTFVLYPFLLNKILIWCAIVIVVVLFRFYSIYRYKHFFEKHTIEYWYVEYFISILVLAFLFSSLSFLFMPELNFYYQLFVITVLLGLSSGAATALSIDFRLALGYMSILVLPLLSVIVSLDDSSNWIFIAALLLYYVAQVSMILKGYQQEKTFNRMTSEREIFNEMFNDAPVGIFAYNNSLIITDCNTQFKKLFGYIDNDVIGLDMNIIPDSSPMSKLKRALSHGPQSYHGAYTTIKGFELWVEAKIFPYKNNSNDTMGGMVFIEDKSKEKEIQNELEHLVEHDTLTGLLNRRGLKNFMDSMVTSQHHQTQYSLLFYLDLNQFKGINDSMGHTVGDAVLLNVSQRLENSLEEKCPVSRLGGDEFIILIPYISEDSEVSKHKAKKYVKRIEKIFENPFIINDIHLHIKASIGIIVIEPKYQNIEEIIRHADIAMYQAKNTHGHISYYNEQLDKEQKELFGLQHDLAYAVDKNQFDLFFQPIVKIKNEQLYSAEALIRWEHPEKGLLIPDAFIPLAIKAGLLSKITWWVVDNVCEHICEWKKFDLWKLEYVSINVNAQQLIENNFADTFLQKLEYYGLETTDIMIEITERSLIDNFDSTQNVINALRGHGVRCAIDDFGVGYSSLSYLKKLSFHTLKIDREFVKEIESNPKELLLVSSILEIGRQFNYNIVIEGVEDKKQKDLLLGLDEELSYQGYYFSKPLHGQEFREKFLYKKS